MDMATKEEEKREKRKKKKREKKRTTKLVKWDVLSGRWVGPCPCFGGGERRLRVQASVSRVSEVSFTHTVGSFFLCLYLPLG